MVDGKVVFKKSYGLAMDPRTGQLWLAKGQRAPLTDGGYIELSAVW